ncbi:hypothetical protein HPP92_016782 [Vanilla planifolia]|uniref:Uncharacterized protein n=1 Tax=Vanilla planifolia TaxID=51239 RepID=A0A835QLU2_VANPL|nr:hypothetical protein HPP92_016782 [Vanilla planifolia]
MDADFSSIAKLFIMFTIQIIKPNQHCPLYILHERGALRGLGIPHCRKQVLSAVHPASIVAGPRGGVHEHLAGVSRICPSPKDSGARSHRLERRVLRPLEVPLPIRIRYRAGKQSGQVDHHPVGTDVTVGRPERRSLRAVWRLVEGPGALPRALRQRVPDPEVGGAAGEAGVGSTSGGAEALDSDVGGGDDEGDGERVGVVGKGDGGEGGKGRGVEDAAEGAGREEDLRAEGDGRGGCGLAVVEASGGPPGGDGGRRWWGAGGEGDEEVSDDGALGGGEVAVPHEVKGQFAGEDAAVVVLENEGWRGYEIGGDGA